VANSAVALRPYSGTVRGKDDLPYSVRFLLTDDERDGLARAGVLPDDVCEIIGMQDAIEQTEVRFEMQAYTALGGQLQ
jgi:hypothetical protein